MADSYVQTARAAGCQDSEEDLKKLFFRQPNPTRGYDSRTGEYKKLSSAKCSTYVKICKKAGKQGLKGDYGNDTTMGQPFKHGLAKPGWVAGEGVGSDGRNRFFIVEDVSGEENDRREWAEGKWEDRTYEQWKAAGGRELPLNGAPLVTRAEFEEIANPKQGTALLPSAATSKHGTKWAAAAAAKRGGT